MADLRNILDEIKQQESQLAWEGTFAEYFDLAAKRPPVARLAHARLYDMILDAGVTTNRLGEREYSLFARELFGAEKALAQVVEYFGAGARRLETRKRILLLVGPPASGKTTLVNLLKKGLERYTRTDRGALYAIKGCPMQEEPLHLIPPDFREELERQYGLYIEGDLCPRCRWMLREQYQGRIDQVKVRRVVLSEALGIGIGTFVATDPGSQDLARLTGGVDAPALEGDRLEHFGKAFHLNGELNVANRGLMEFVELFKLDERFLAVLLVLTEEQKIKAPGFGTIYADEAILAHSNEAEYEALVSNKKTEALQDRIVVVRVPYNLRVSEETRIYEKLLREVDLQGAHLAPLSLPTASIFAVLSRLQPSQRFGMSLVKKMRLYDGQFVEGVSPKEVEALREESPREGMIGVSPRFVINQIARAVSQPEVKCLDPLDLLQTLWEGLEQSTTLAREEQRRLYTLFLETRREYDEMATREVQKAFVDHFDQAAAALAREYIDSVTAYTNRRNGRNGHNGGTEPGAEPNDKLMHSLERAIHIQDSESAEFRQEIYTRATALKQAGQPISYRLDARLEEALVRRLCPNTHDMARVLAPRETRTPELAAKRDEVFQRLMRERGYEAECAERLLEHVAQTLNVGEKSRAALPKAMRWLRG